MMWILNVYFPMHSSFQNRKKGRGRMKKGYFYIAVAVVMFTSFEVVLKFIAGQINPAPA